MSNSKKKTASRAKTPQAPPKQASQKKLWVIGAVVVVAVVAAVAVAGQKPGGSGGGAKGGAPADEAKYIGRLLPDGYEAPKVGGTTAVAGTVQSTQIQAQTAEKSLSIPVNEVVANKIVSFEYAREGKDAIPLLAYVRPSGKLFVGVSYCPPCEGEGQRLEGGTLTCETCGTKREPESQVGISGACKLYPLDELPATVVDDLIVIDTAALDSWTSQPLDRPVGG